MWVRSLDWGRTHIPRHQFDSLDYRKGPSMADEVVTPEVVVSVLPTNVSLFDSGSGYVSQPVMGVYALYQTSPPAPAAPVEDEDEEAKAAKDAVEAKVITNPGKEQAAAKAANASASVETK